MATSAELGKEKISKLLIRQSVPAAIGFMVMSVYTIVDTIFVGQWVGANGIGAVSVVLPISFLISSIGMAIGVGGGSIIARSLGEEKTDRAARTFGTQIVMTLGLSSVLLVIGLLFAEEILVTFGARGEILDPAFEYFTIILLGSPFLAWAMMANNVIRSEGKPKVAMYTMIIPAVLNLILDPIFIIVMDWGLAGAAWATAISYFSSAMYTLQFFLRKQSEIKVDRSFLKVDFGLAREIFAIGGVSLARQGSVTVLSAVLNTALFNYGGEIGVATFGVINRVMMFSLFPVIGTVQGFMPIAGFNYGARNAERVVNVIRTAIKYGMIMGSVTLALILLFSPYIVKVFTDNQELINATPSAMVWVFLSSPLIAAQLIGSAYFQAIGKALPALLLTLTKQGMFLIPLILFMPDLFGIQGIWMSFPIADILATTVTVAFLGVGVKRLRTRFAV
jgi:putative MATE family efflux protein